jgi:hypothetical protein
MLVVEDYALLLSHGSPWREPINRAVLQTISSTGWKAMLKRYIVAEE